MVFEDFPVYHVNSYNRDLKYQYDTNGILNAISFYSSTQASLTILIELLRSDGTEGSREHRNSTSVKNFTKSARTALISLTLYFASRC